MDLSTITKRLKNRYYWQALECVQDLNTMFANCYVYNKVSASQRYVRSATRQLRRLPFFPQPGDGVVFMAQTLEKIYREKLALMPKPECEVKGGKMSEGTSQHQMYAVLSLFSFGVLSGRFDHAAITRIKC